MIYLFINTYKSTDLSKFQTETKECFHAPENHV